MTKRRILIFSIPIFIILFFAFKLLNKDPKPVELVLKKKSEEILYKSNIIKNVFYSSKDAKGNEYVIYAKEGEIDYSNTSIVFLTEVEAFIKLTNSNEIKIDSEFGKYNINNFDTIFSKNVRVKYLENKITSEYMDFSLNRNSMIISKNVVYTNLENIMNADVIEININNKNTKITRFNINDKVNIKSKNWYGNNKEI